MRMAQWKFSIEIAQFLAYALCVLVCVYAQGKLYIARRYFFDSFLFRYFIDDDDKIFFNAILCVYGDKDVPFESDLQAI